MRSVHEVKLLLLSALGITGCYLAYGILQERIYTHSSGEFRFTTFLLFVQCCVNALVSLLGTVAARGTTTATALPAAALAPVGFAYVAAMFCSNEALRYVSYPAQSLAKSCKLVPVMLVGRLVGGREYARDQYAAVGLITAGIVAFNAAGHVSHHAAETGSSSLGIALLALSLALDGLTGPLQDIAKSKYGPSALQLMLHTNAWALLYLVVALVATGEIGAALAFCGEQPALVVDLLLFGLASAVGQLFVFYTLHRFDALVLGLVTTVRKFLTILISVLWFGNPVSRAQWLAVLAVFAGIAFDLRGRHAAAGAPPRRTRAGPKAE